MPPIAGDIGAAGPPKCPGAGRGPGAQREGRGLLTLCGPGGPAPALSPVLGCTAKDKGVP